MSTEIKCNLLENMYLLASDTQKYINIYTSTTPIFYDIRLIVFLNTSFKRIRTTLKLFYFTRSHIV